MTLPIVAKTGSLFPFRGGFAPRGRSHGLQLVHVLTERTFRGSLGVVMARSLRLEYPGALWHVTSRGNNKQPIFNDDDDREQFLELVCQARRRYGWIITVYVLMTNHFHL